MFVSFSLETDLIFFLLFLNAIVEFAVVLFINVSYTNKIVWLCLWNRHTFLLFF